MGEKPRLDDKATQVEFAALVGVTQPAISRRVAAGVLPAGGTFGDWISAYCSALRSEAAGRGGAFAESLTAARTEQARADTRMKELQYYRELKLLVPVEEIEPMLAGWAATARSEVGYAVEKLVAGIRSKHGVEVTQDEVDAALLPAFRAIAEYPKRLSDDAVGEGGGCA